MIRRRKRSQPIESESSEDDNSYNGRLENSIRSTNFYSSEISNTNKRYNTRKRRKVPIIVSEDSSASETEEIAHLPRHGSMRAVSDYDTFNSSDTEEEELSPQAHDVNDVSGNETDSSDNVIQTRSGKRFKRFESSSSTDSSDSGVPILFHRRKKRIKLCSSSSEDCSNEESTLSLDLGLNNRGGSQERQNSDNMGNRNNMTRIRLFIGGGWSMSVGNVENDSLSVRVSQTDDPEFGEFDYRLEQAVRNHSRRVLQSNSSSSSDSEDEFPVRRPRNRRVDKSIIESDEDDKSGNENSTEILSESDDATEVCPICLNRFNLQVIGKPSNCDHCFCFTCIKEWAGNNNICPVDRLEFTAIRVHSSIHSNVVEEIPVSKTQLVDNDWDVDELLDENELHELTQLISFELSSEDVDEPEGEICCICSIGCGNYDNLYCDSCFRVYHLRCIDPPIHSIPVGAWFCAHCENN